MISLEKFVRLEFNWDWAISEHFLQDLLFSDLTPTFANELGIQNFSNRWASFVIGALLSLGLAFIWSTLIGDHIATFHKVSVHVRPATLTTLVEEVALHDLLGRHDWNLLTILKFESCLGSLYKSNGVAWATLTLITNWSSKVIPIDISKIIRIWDVRSWNILWRRVLLFPFLCLLKSFFEQLIVLSSKLVKSHSYSLFTANLSQHVLRMNWSTINFGGAYIIRDHKHLIIFAVLSLCVIFMMFLQLASARFPAKISWIDCGNK